MAAEGRHVRSSAAACFEVLRPLRLHARMPTRWIGRSPLANGRGGGVTAAVARKPNPKDAPATELALHLDLPA